MFYSKKGLNRKGQIWVETVIYILIAFVMIGLVLSFVKPKIEELRDKAIIEQSIEIMNSLESVFSEVVIPGNKRVLEMGIKKGEFTIDAVNDTIIFEITSSYVYSEPGEIIYIGDLQATTTDLGKYSKVVIISDYSERYNLTYQNREASKILTRTSVPYKIVITNKGEDVSGNAVIDIDLI